MSLDSLKSLDLAELKPLAGFGIDESKLANTALRLPSGRTQMNRFRHSFQVIEKASRAAELVMHLPGPGESIHCILKGDFPLFDFIPATIKLNDGKPINRLRIATLGFSKKNVDDLAALTADGLVKHVSILCSHYFSAVDAEIVQHFRGTLPQFRIMPMRTHAKVVLIEAPGLWISIESSANLRSCHNIEQATVTNSRELHDFHAGWIDDMLLQGARAAGQIGGRNA